MSSFAFAEADGRRHVECNEYDERLAFAAQAQTEHEKLATARAMATLQRATAAREVEWKSMVDNSRTMLKADEERRIAQLTADKDSEISARDERVQQLQQIVGAKERVIADLYQQVAAADDTMQAKLREQKRDMAAAQEELRLDAQRLAGHRERLRLESEAAMNARDAQKALAESATHRATRATKDACTRQLRATEAMEYLARHQIETAADQLFDALTATRNLARLTVLRTQKQTTRQLRSLRRLVDANNGPDSEQGSSTEISDSSSNGSGDDEDTARGMDRLEQAPARLAKNQASIERRLHRAAERTARRSRRTDTNVGMLRHTVDQLRAQIAAQDSELERVKTESEERVVQLAERCHRAQERLGALRKLHEDAAQLRARQRSGDSMIEQLVAEHDEAIAGLRSELAAAEDRARRFAQENGHEDLEKIVAKHARLLVDHEAATREVTDLRRKVTALKATVEADGSNTANLTVENRQLARDMEQLRKDSAYKVSVAEGAAADAKSRAADAEDRLEKAAEALRIKAGVLDELTTEHNGLRGRVDQIRMQCAEAEQRASDLERERRLAIDRAMVSKHERQRTRERLAEAAEASASMDADGLNDLVGPNSPVKKGSSSARGTAGDDNGGGDLIPGTISTRQAEEISGFDLSKYDATDAAIEALENKLVLVKRERDTLRRQLSVAMAEVSAAEERRTGTVEKYLALLNASDAAPRRELGLRQQEQELKKIQTSIDERTAELDRRELELKKREIAVQSKSNAVTKMVRRLEAQASHGGGGAFGRGGGGGGGQLRLADTVSNSSSSVAMSPVALAASDRAPNKLTPLIHRPPHVASSPGVSHPQLPPPQARSATPGP